MKTGKLNIALIGAGNMGRNHARIYSELPNVNLVAICDTNEKLARQLAKHYGCLAYQNHQQMLAEQQIDAVSIAVPTFLHYKIGCDVLDKNIHVLLEKPIATNLKEAREILKKAKKRNLVLMIGHIERFNPAVRRLSHLINKKRLGEIISLNIRRVGGTPPQTKNANVVMDLAIHDIDIANFLIQDLPTETHGFKSKRIINDQEDNALILLKYPNAFAFIEVNWTTPIKIRTLDITGTKAFARLDYLEQKITLYENDYSSSISQWKNYNEFLAKTCSTDTIQVGINKAEPLKCELEEFISAIQENREPIFPPQEAYKALEIALKI